MIIPKLFNKADIARALWPNNKDAASHLSRKIAERDGKKLTPVEKEQIINHAEAQILILKNNLK